MNGGQLLWVAGAYLAGTFPSTLLVARLNGAGSLVKASGRKAGETDPHVLMQKALGSGWAAVASTLDVVKAFAFVLAAREWGHLPPNWLALVGVATVVGHTYPFYARAMAGRGMAAAAGVLLVLLPVEMVVAGIIYLLGAVLRSSGLFSTIGMASVPAVAAAQRQPNAFVAMGGAIFLVLMLRRLEGVGKVIRSGVPPGRAFLYRCVFDSSGPPSESRAPETGLQD